jgi:hypothetical protein
MFAGIAADRVQNEISFGGLAERIRFDAADAVIVGQIDAELVRSGEPDDLEN